MNVCVPAYTQEQIYVAEVLELHIDNWLSAFLVKAMTFSTC